ncbi:hypothetical protein [Butyrivibrio sp. AD3002]|uniref:hypothetical protein n=1 Tax=Butyrivibrio sp. AD3002 TaxID=1280670 RepID=UPI0003B32E5F|nr:hypothetical protein [Butyrivibrio sp. AD3002]
MEDLNNIGGYRSVYMAFGAFKIGTGASQVKSTVNSDSEVPSFLTAMNLATEKATETGDVTNTGDDAKVIKASESSPYGQGAFLSYTRIITAKMPSDITGATEKSTGSSAFDVSSGQQELKITINVSGGSRIYTASGIDKDGNSFSKEIDPYSVDPTNTDYAGFATLCAYIRDTEGLADNAMKAVKNAMPEDITENGNYLYKVGFAAETDGNLSGAKKLFEQMETFFEKLMNIGREDTTSEKTGVTSVSTKSYNNIVDELNSMIQQMIQQMLNEIMGNRDDEKDVADSKEDAPTAEDALDLENAKTI